MHELIKKRRSYRNFTDEEVTDEQVKQILTSAMAGASGVHLNPWQFVVVRDQETKEKLAATGKFITFIKKAPVVIVVCAKDTRLWVQDCSIAAAHIYLEATNQGLGTCWGNVFQSKSFLGDPREESIRKILNIPEKIRIMCVMPLGHPAMEKPEHSDADYKESKVHNEEW